MLAKVMLRNNPLIYTGVRMFGVLEDMESKLQAQFKPQQLKIDDPNGDLYKVDVRKNSK